MGRGVWRVARPWSLRREERRKPPACHLVPSLRKLPMRRMMKSTAFSCLGGAGPPHRPPPPRGGRESAPWENKERELGRWVERGTRGRWISLATGPVGRRGRRSRAMPWGEGGGLAPGGDRTIGFKGGSGFRRVGDEYNNGTACGGSESRIPRQMQPYQLLPVTL